MTGAARSLGGLDAAVARLESRGLRLRRGVGAPEGTELDPARPPIPTGEPALDAALGTGGWPRGGVSTLAAAPGRGATSLALGTLRACQAAGGLAAWLDTDAGFDVAGAERRGVDLRWLLLVLPRDAGEAIELAGWLCRARLLDLLVLDLGATAAAGERLRALERLGAVASRTGSGVILLGSAADVAPAAVRVRLERVSWLAVGRDLVGQRVEAVVARSQRAAPGGRAVLDLWFVEGRRVDPLLAAGARPLADAPPLVDGRRARVLSA